jgi:hypothetical protein
VREAPNLINSLTKDLQQQQNTAPVHTRCSPLYSKRGAREKRKERGNNFLAFVCLPNSARERERAKKAKLRGMN